MNTIVKPTGLSGSIEAITSKSYVHRALISALISGKKSEIYCNNLSDDITATANALKSIGCDIEYKNNYFTVTPKENYNLTCEIDCGESGSTLRFILPVICALGIDATLIMRGKLSKRPMTPLIEILEKNGCNIKKKENKLSVSGNLKPNTYEIAGNISSQYITGLLFTLPLLESNAKVVVKGDFQSKSYVNLTVDVLERFGLIVNEVDNCYSLGDTYSTVNKISSDGDWSNSAFWLCAGALSDEHITVTGLDLNSVQGDKKIVEILEKFGAEALLKQNSVSVKKGILKGTTVDASDIPDLVPILSVVASFSDGKTVINNVERLRLKESDRIKTTVEMITNLGGRAEVKDNSIIIYHSPLKGGTVNSYNDHRIVMSSAVAGIFAESQVTILNSEAVNKSYPKFFKDFEKLGGIYKEEN